jgi:hypothetical protein
MEAWSGVTPQKKGTAVAPPPPAPTVAPLPTAQDRLLAAIVPADSRSDTAKLNSGREEQPPVVVAADKSQRSPSRPADTTQEETPPPKQGKPRTSVGSECSGFGIDDDDEKTPEKVPTNESLGKQAVQETPRNGTGDLQPTLGGAKLGRRRSDSALLKSTLTMGQPTLGAITYGSDTLKRISSKGSVGSLEKLGRRRSVSGVLASGTTSDDSRLVFGSESASTVGTGGSKSSNGSGLGERRSSANKLAGGRRDSNGRTRDFDTKFCGGTPVGRQQNKIAAVRQSAMGDW